MPGLKNYRVFIAHCWSYDDDYNRLVSLLSKASLFEWSNYSVPKKDPLQGGTDAALERQIRSQMSPTQIVLVASGMYVAYRDWIGKEIDIATSMGKPIVGIKPWGSERVPAAVQLVAREVVNWNTDSIVAAIRKHAI